MRGGDIFEDCETIKKYLPRLDEEFSWCPPTERRAELLSFWDRNLSSDNSKWYRKASHYSNMFELIAQQEVVRVLNNPHPALRLNSVPDPSRVMVRCVKSPFFIMEHRKVGDNYFIVFSDPAYVLPFHLGLCQSLVSDQCDGISSKNRVLTNYFSGRSVESVIFDAPNRGQVFLNSLWASNMDVLTGVRQDIPGEFILDLDRENQESFVEHFIWMLRLGGQSPFDQGISFANPFFPVAFILYGVMHELGHVLFQHNSGIRDFAEELGSDMVAALLLEQLTPGYVSTIPLAVGSAAIFYSTLSYLTALQELIHFRKGETADVSRFYSPATLAHQAANVGVKAELAELREYSLVNSRAVGAAALLQEVCGKDLAGTRNDARMFWDLCAELRILTHCTLDPDLSHYMHPASDAELIRFQEQLKGKVRDSIGGWTTDNFEKSATLYRFRQDARES